MKRIFAWIDSAVNKLVKNYTLWIVAGVVVLGIIAYRAYTTVFVRLPEPPVYSSYQVVPPQRKDGAAQPENRDQSRRDEWTDEQRERYYQTSQGSLVMPYAWFRALEWRTSRERFAAPNVQARYGLLPDNDTRYNKDLMPVGIVKNIVQDADVETLGEGQKEWASISCAACHTGQLTYKGNAMRIDGGQSFWNFETWSTDMVFSLLLTTTVPTRFERFCARVYGLPEPAKCNDVEKTNLRRQVKRYTHSNLLSSGINALIQHTYPIREGFTRTTALGRGVNGEFGPTDPCSGPLDRHCDRNITRSTGAVSFPPLWYTHEYDWVQSPAAIRQPLGRNVTEAWGVSVRVELKPGDKQFASTANIDDMFWMETLISILQAPRWPEDVFGPIDRAKAERGRYLYNDAVWPQAPAAEQAEQPADKASKILGPNPDRPKTGYCARCHAPAFEPEKVWPTEANAPTNGIGAHLYDQKFLQLPLYRQNVLDTDPDDARQFASRQVHTGELAPLFKNLNPPVMSPELVDIGTALSVTISGILDRWFTEHKVSGDCRQIMQGHRQNLFRAPLGYPARPLDGYWATGPFLHNGSVRTIYELLSPVSERAKAFWVGTREFDPVHLGFRDDPIEGAFRYDTSLDGNSNRGHEFRDAPLNTVGVIGPYLTPEDRLAIIEYLKVLRSVQELLDGNPATKDRLVERNALLAAMTPFYEKNYRKYGESLWVEPGNQPESEGGFDRVAFCQAIEKAAQAQPAQTKSPAGTPTPK
jgi:hypothetical protein